MTGTQSQAGACATPVSHSLEQNERMRVTVVVCTYFGEEFIGAQLESILRQTRRVDELIVCDDGSTDGTVEVARETIRAHGDRVESRVVVNPSRRGIRKNCEGALAQATGDIIFLSDQDDVWVDTRVEEMLAPFARDPEVHLVYANAIVTDAQLRPTQQFLWPGVHRELTPRNVAARLGICSCAMAFRASLREFVLPIPEGWWHDHWIACGAFALGKVECLAKPLMYYRLHDRAWYADGLPIVGGRPRRRISAVLNGLRELPRRLWELRVDGDVSARHRRELLARLEGLGEDSFPRLAVHVAQLRENVRFVEARERLRGLGPIGRCRAVYRLARAGDYRRYASGARSALRDLFAPRVWRRRWAEEGKRHPVWGWEEKARARRQTGRGGDTAAVGDAEG